MSEEDGDKSQLPEERGLGCMYKLTVTQSGMVSLFEKEAKQPWNTTFRAAAFGGGNAILGIVTEACRKSGGECRHERGGSPGMWRELVAVHQQQGAENIRLFQLLAEHQKTLLEQITTTQAQANQQLWVKVMQALVARGAGGSCSPFG